MSDDPSDLFIDAVQSGAPGRGEHVFKKSLGVLRREAVEVKYAMIRRHDKEACGGPYVRSSIRFSQRLLRVAGPSHPAPLRTKRILA